MEDGEQEHRGVPCEGVVTRNDDPLKIGRVKAVIPGVIEPETDWILPWGSQGGGELERGSYFPPDVGAEIGVIFVGEDHDQPRFLCGPWGAPGEIGQGPSWLKDLSPEEAPQVKGIQTKRFNIIIDEREGHENLLISDRLFPSDSFEIDGVSHGVAVRGTAAVAIESVGVVSIKALQVIINGRVVKDSNDPI